MAMYCSILPLLTMTVFIRMRFSYAHLVGTSGNDLESNRYLLYNFYSQINCIEVIFNTLKTKICFSFPTYPSSGERYQITNGIYGIPSEPQGYTVQWSDRPAPKSQNLTTKGYSYRTKLFEF